MKALAVVLAALAVSALPTFAHARQVAEPATADCTTFDGLTAGTAIRHTERDDGLGDIKLATPSSVVGDFYIYNEIYVSGPCATHLTQYQFSTFSFGAVALQALDGGKWQFIPNASSGFYLDDRAIPPSGAHPDGIAGTFQGAIGVDARGHGVKYAGIWQDGQRSSVYLFTRREDGSFTGVAQLLTAASAIRRLSYVPSPDTMLGGLNVLQDVADGVKITGIEWNLCPHIADCAANW